MGLVCCDRCWERPCVCGYEKQQKEKFRREFYAQLAADENVSKPVGVTMSDEALVTNILKLLRAKCHSPNHALSILTLAQYYLLKQEQGDEFDLEYAAQALKEIFLGAGD